MHSAVGARRFPQSVDEGRAELGVETVFEYLVDYLVLADYLLQYLRFGGVGRLAGIGYFKILEQHFGELLGRVEVELRAVYLDYARRALFFQLGEMRVDIREPRTVYHESVALHIEQHTAERQFHAAV